MDSSNRSLCIVTLQHPEHIQKIIEEYYTKYDIITTKQLIAGIPYELRRIRKRKYNTAKFLTYDIQQQNYLEIFKLLLLFTGAKEKYIVDISGKIIKITWLKSLIKDIPKLVIEFIASLILIFYIYIQMSFINTNDKPKKLKNKGINKIAYLRTDHWFGIEAGGSVGHIAGVANALYDFGYNVFFVSTDSLKLVKIGKTPAHIIKPSYLFFNNIPEIPELAYNFKLIKEAKKIFQAEKPDLIYQRYSLNNYTGIILSREFNIPFIIEYNGSFLWMGKYWNKPLNFRKVSEIIELVNLRSADLIVVVSKPMRDELIERGIDERKILVNPNGVNSEKFSPEIDGIAVREKYNLFNKIIIGFIGTFGLWHGADILAGTIKHIMQKNPNVHFIFIGDGPMMPKVKEIIKRDEVKSFITFTGLIPQEESPKYLAACDIFISPHVPNPDGTPFFGSPTKLFEYMAMGKGIVASDLDQIGEVLKHNHNAILVEPGNIDQLVDGILALMENKELREKLGRQAREDVIANYTWKKNVERVLNALGELLNENNT